MTILDGQEYLTTLEAKALLGVPYMTFLQVLKDNPQVQSRIETETNPDTNEIMQVAYYLKTDIESLQPG